jgi:spermidine/putrescine transport system permease protein
LAAGTSKGLREGRRTPYLLALPGLLFLFLFFVVPLIALFEMSLSTKPDRFLPQYAFTWQWSNFARAFTEFGPHLARSFAYAGIATLLCLAIAYPIAYFLAFRAGRLRGLLLGLVMVPFFTSFLLRTIAWQSLLADAGPVLRLLRALALDGLLESVGILESGKLLQTEAAVIGGLTYNFLPFMLLPIYVSLERIDTRLLDAAADLYSSFARTFRKVVLPLSLPGVFAGTLLTFIPASGDFVNAELLGSTESRRVIGNAVRAQFLNRNDYPSAAAISFVLMALIIVAVVAYARFLDADDLA